MYITCIFPYIGHISNFLLKMCKLFCLVVCCIVLVFLNLHMFVRFFSDNLCYLCTNNNKHFKYFKLLFHEYSYIYLPSKCIQ